MKRKKLVLLIILTVMMIAVYVRPAYGGSSYKDMGKGIVRFLEPDEVTNKVLSARKGKYLVVEVCYGKVTDAKGNGKILNTRETYFNYISYKGVKGAKQGKRVLTILVYGNTKYNDDIVIRIDKVL